MTIKVTAVKNASITKHGFKFTRGVTKTDIVPYSVAMQLMQDKRFKVEITPDEHVRAATAVQSGEGGTKPRDKKAVLAAINAAIGQLDLDTESNWLEDGRPDARALTKALGWQVTSAERDAALRAAERGEAISAPGENEAGDASARGDVKVSDLKGETHKGKLKLTKRTPAVEEPSEPEGNETTSNEQDPAVEDDEEETEETETEEVEETEDETEEAPAEDGDLIEDAASQADDAPARPRTVRKAVPSRKAAKINLKKAAAEDTDPSTAGAKEV